MRVEKNSKKKQAYKELKDLTIENNGMLVHKKAREEGIHPVYIQEYKEEYRLEEVLPGVYSEPNAFIDEMFALQKRYTKGIYSHESALVIWELTDVIPMEFVMTFPQGYNNPSVKEWGIHPKYSNEKRYEIGITSAKTEYGNPVSVYNKERTLCDLLQKRHHTEKSILIEAIKRYAGLEDKNLGLLMKYANLFNVEKTIRLYLEVLL